MSVMGASSVRLFSLSFILTYTNKKRNKKNLLHLHLISLPFSLLSHSQCPQVSITSEILVSEGDVPTWCFSPVPCYRQSGFVNSVHADQDWMFHVKDRQTNVLYGCMTDRYIPRSVEIHAADLLFGYGWALQIRVFVTPIPLSIYTSRERLKNSV